MTLSAKYDDALQQAASIIANCKHLIAFTGAGVSADSGVPTFRGQGGLWGKYDENHLQLQTFIAEPDVCWATIHRIFYEQAQGFEPNAAHRILAKWEQLGILDFLITQNIDGLHTRAGSKKISEFHGSCARLQCMRCGVSVEAQAVLDGLMNNTEADQFFAPRCSCGGVYKPDFVFFGEGIPHDAFSASFEAAERADACLVIG
ncbi:MAG TPA: Sir2 family NAD-dependent protein deacetylase, partial [Spirochaetales bacterium]|nr:Sir2 family NAD-dependent protein deacetylase [Spirochaetales bacterium]